MSEINSLSRLVASPYCHCHNVLTVTDNYIRTRRSYFPVRDIINLPSVKDGRVLLVSTNTKSGTD